MKAMLAIRSSSLSSPTPPYQTLLPESVVTSNSREKSRGHSKRAASTVCSFTASGVAFDWVYGAYMEWKTPDTVSITLPCGREEDNLQCWSSPSTKLTQGLLLLTVSWARLLAPRVLEILMSLPPVPLQVYTGIAHACAPSSSFSQACRSELGLSVLHSKLFIH